MKEEVTVHDDGVGDERADEVKGTRAAAGDGDISLRGVDGADEGSTAIELDGGVAGHAVVGQIEGVAAIGEGAAREVEGGAGHVDGQVAGGALGWRRW